LIGRSRWITRRQYTSQKTDVFGAVAESNQGGEMVRTVLKGAGAGLRVRLAWAGTSKAARAEPVAMLYAQGRVRHAGGLEALEAELAGLTAGGRPRRSPDRADALVWALSELMVRPTPALPRVTAM
jgi:phage terminase large subunit-like protein